MYDGFISYSHAADGLLAPRLQAGLQRFAKPWWKRRAVRMFRDEASLSANPHLWESIVDAMDQSEWLVLLLSPEAAESAWVNREIEYWTAKRDISRILPVVTEGSFAWRDGEVSGSAVPPALRGTFSGEPRWVDMRFAHSDEQLDLKSPEFLDSVADIASTLRGVPKDELASEEVRQHRRTVRTAWVAGVALVALSIAAVAFAVQANEQRAIAEENERRAEASAEEALKNAAAEAEARQDAEAARAEAEFEAAVSEMRALTAWSSTELDRDPELATLLALLATALAPEQRYENEARDELRESIAANRLLARFNNPNTLAWPYNYGVITADGTTVYAVQMLDVGNRVVSIDVESGEVETFHESDTDDADTRWVAISASGLLAFDVTTGEGDSYIQVVDTSTGATRILPRDGCQDLPVPPHFSPDGRYLTFMNGTDACGPDHPEADWADIYDTSTWDRAVWSRPGADFEWIQFGAGSDRALLTSCDLEFLCLHELVSYPDFEPIESRRGFMPNLNAEGDRLVYLYAESEAAFGETVIVDLDSDSAVGIEEDPNQGWFTLGFLPYLLSPDGDFLAVRTVPVRVGQFQTVRIVRAEDGVLVGELPDFAIAPLGELLVHLSWADGRILLTSSTEGLLLWDAAPVTERAIRANVEDLVELALDSLTRSFTSDECSRFALSVCPSQDDLHALLDSG